MTPSSLKQAPPSLSAWLAMAFRPFYTVGCAWAAITVLLWGWGVAPPFAPGSEREPLLTGLLWHGHEMVWGFAGAIVVGFLHTAVTNWTGLPPLAGWRLALVVLFWVAARVAAALAPTPGWIAVPAALFWFSAAETLWYRIWQRRQKQNYPVPVLVAVLGSLELGLLLTRAGDTQWGNPLAYLEAGVLTVAAIIAFMGLRVIPFFTSRALDLEPIAPSPSALAFTVGGVSAVAGATLLGLPPLAVLVLSLLTAFGYLERSARWYHPRIWQNPAVWVLHLGFAATGLGIAAYGLTGWAAPSWKSAALHLLTVGGMGWMILGMVTRTALGHTGGNPNATLPGIPTAFILIGAATVLRLCAALPTAWAIGALRLSAILFAVAFAIYLVRFFPRLIRPRPDGRPG